MTEWASLAFPWLFVTNTILFGALSGLWFMRGRYAEAILFLWAAVAFLLGAIPLLD